MPHRRESVRSGIHLPQCHAGLTPRGNNYSPTEFLVIKEYQNGYVYRGSLLPGISTEREGIERNRDGENKFCYFWHKSDR
jgi:hypothetical protein